MPRDKRLEEIEIDRDRERESEKEAHRGRSKIVRKRGETKIDD